jgi:hypothetical protein
MPLPTSFKAIGATTLNEARMRRKIPGGTRPGVLIKNYGPTNSGKTEFGLSCPDPGIHLMVDKQSDAVWDNPTPPESRRPNWGLVDYQIPMPTQAGDYKEAWQNYYTKLKQCWENPDANTIVVDGDVETWELQLLADHGKVTQIMPIARTGTNAARRALLSRLYFSGKVVVCTHRVKPEYETVYTAEGKPKLDNSGNEVRRDTGRAVCAGFNDDNYLWHFVLEHFTVEAKKEVVPVKVGKITVNRTKETPMQWGIRIIKCKANPSLQGRELIGDECNFPSLVQLAYPQVPMDAWGIKGWGGV